MIKQRDWLIATLILLVLAAVWLFGLNWIFMRPDEHLVYKHTAHSLRFTVWYQANHDVQAPMWHSFFWAWRRLAGDSEFAGRYQGILFSLLTVSWVFRLMLAWFKQGRYGWFAMMVVGVNAYFFTYAFEIRPYPLVLLVSTLSVWMMWRWLTRRTWRTAIFYGLSLALLAYVHYFQAFLVAMQFLYIVINRPGRRMWRQYALAAVVAVIAWAPWALTFISQVQALQALEGSLGIASTTATTSPSVIARLIARATNGLPLVWLVILAMGAVYVRRREYIMLLLWGLGVPVFTFTVNLFANVYDPRYIVYTSIGLSAGAGVAIAALPLRYVRLGLLAGFVGLLWWNIPPHLPDRATYRTFYQTMTAMSQPGDVMVVTNEDTDGFLTWHMNQYLAPALRENIVSVSEAVDARRVWFVTNDLFDPAVQAQFRQIERTHPLQFVMGECSAWCYMVQLLEGPPSQEELAVFTYPPNSDQLNFHGTDIGPVRDNAIAIRLWWRVEVPLQLNYSIGLQVLDEQGALVAQVDGPPNHYQDGSLSTTEMQAESVVIDERELVLPPETAPGIYRLVLVVYEPGSGQRLTVDGDDVLPLQTITIP